MTDETMDSDDKVRQQADRLWGNLKKGLQDGAEIAMNKAEELTQVGRARLDVAAAKTKLSRLQIELGALVFDRLEADAPINAEDAEIESLRSQIRVARAEVADAESAQEDLRRVRTDD